MVPSPNLMRCIGGGIGIIGVSLGVTANQPNVGLTNFAVGVALGSGVFVAVAVVVTVALAVWLAVGVAERVGEAVGAGGTVGVGVAVGNTVVQPAVSHNPMLTHSIRCWVRLKIGFKSV
jgi:drug/metabolite transporter (DMT)-like permease